MIAEIVIDLAGLTGALLISFGAWCIYEPAGFISLGLFLIVGAVLLSRG